MSLSSEAKILLGFTSDPYPSSDEPRDKTVNLELLTKLRNKINTDGSEYDENSEKICISFF